LDHYDSGRDFLQEIADEGKPLARATFFDALHQPRRLVVVKEVSERFINFAEKEMASVNWLKDVPGLGERPVLAVDGQQIEHACHALRDGKGGRVPPGYLYILDLRKGLMHALGAHQGNGQRMHEVKAFKALFSAQLAAKRFAGRPIIVADMGFIDNAYWTRLRLNLPDAPVIITRQKDNMKPLSYGPIPFDRANPINVGVVGYEMVGFDNCLQMYRVTYKDPGTGAEFVFLTSDSTLLPGVVALLYRLRWKIEKTYNTCKSKLHLTKAWANGTVAQELQAHFTALAHNLLSYFLYRLDSEHGITEEKLLVIHDKAEQVRIQNKIPYNSFYLIARIALQLSCQFIRLVRNLLRHPIPWIDALPLFKQRLQNYL
jgi:hypothetical protein